MGTAPQSDRTAARQRALGQPAAPARFDVFLSHHSADKPAIERIARALQERGLAPWLDVWELTPGGDWQAELAAGLRASRACAVFVGTQGAGAWSAMEARLALDLATKDPIFRVFAVLLPGVAEPFDPATLPPFLAAYSWVDLRRGVEDDASLKRLERAIRGLPGLAAPPATAAPVPEDPARAATIPAGALPTGMLTFLFTDVEGSSPLWERHETTMRAVTARHDTLLNGIIVEYGGQRVRERGEGDSLFAVFTDPAAAVAAALAMARALQTEPWPPETPIRVRMALHTGSAQLRAGDYYGPVVNRCARIRSLGHGGQILLSAAAAALVRDALPAGASLRSLGAHALRGLSTLEQLFQLCHPDLPSEFPPPLSPGAPQHNLPLALSSFIGREREQGEVLALLSSARLVTLTGAGGCGKTRLALAAAEALLGEYPDGVWLAEFASLMDLSLVPQVMAQLLGLREEAGRPLLSVLVDHLKDRELLLVLDNCEHLVDACAAMATELLRGCPRLRLLATSREALRVPGERAYRVPSLATPSLDHLPPPEELAGYAAVELFVVRAQGRRAGFALNEQNARAVAAVCVRLDGMPLAIELAAARVGGMGVKEMAARLDDRFRLLTAGARTALPRQQTLRATLDWSYDLLSQDEQQLLDRLSVFAGGCMLAAAEAVCSGGGIEVWEVLDLLGSLVNKSLVLLEDPGPDLEQGRYHLLETVRQYGQERLESRADATMVRERHAAFFLTLAEEAKLHLSGRKDPLWRARLATEQDNLRAARRWFLMRGAADEVLRLAIAHEMVMPMEWPVEEAVSDLEQALALQAAAPDRARAVALVLFGWGTMTQGNTSTGRRVLEEGLMLASRLEDRPTMARALLGLGMLATWQGEYPRARTLLEESLALYRPLSDWWGLAKVLGDLGRVVNLEGDHTRARALLDEALAVATSAGEHGLVAFALEVRGELAFAVGDYAAAGRLWEESLNLYKQLGTMMGIVNVQNFLGLLAVRQGDNTAARARYQSSLEHQRGWLVWAIQSIAGLAAVAAVGGQAEQALRLAGAAIALGEAAARRLPDPEQEMLRNAIETARATLEEGAATTAWAAGQAMTLAEAIAEALRSATA